MTPKQLLALFCITLFLHTSSIPTNTPTENEFLRRHLLQPIQKHPKKTIVGTPLLVYGIKLVYEGNKTRAIKPDKGAYDMLGLATERIGGVLITVGTALLYQVIRDAIFPENSTIEKSDNPEDTKQK